ncbi:MAG: hypothetical protein JWR39_662 [Devosia sp.]|nr:hypothetical protein [Devosia sp.]
MCATDFPTGALCLRAFDSQIDLYQLLGVLWARRWAVLLVLGAVMGLGYVAVSRVPRLYESSATILVEPRPNFYGMAVEGQTRTDRSIVSSNVQLMRSRDTLAEAAEKLNLADLPEFNGGETGSAARDAAVRALEERTLVINELGTAMIWLRVRASDRELARLLTLTIAETAMARRAEQRLDDARQALAWLNNAIPELRRQVSQAEEAVARLRITNGTVSNLPEGSLVAGQLSDMAGRRLAAQERRGGFAARAGVLRARIAAGGSLVGSTDLAADARGGSLIQQRASLRGQLAAQASRLAPNHPTIAGLQAQIAEVDRELTLVARQVAEELERQAAAEADLAAALNADQESLQQTAAGEERDGVSVAALEREAAGQRLVLEHYLAQREAARAQVDARAAFPDMRLVSQPAVASAPVSPKTGLVLLAIAIAGGAAVLTWLIVTSLVARRVDPARRSVAPG